MKHTGLLLAAQCVLLACGSAGFAEPEWTTARARPSPPIVPELVLGSMALFDPEEATPLVALREDGRIEHSSCTGRLAENGEARDEHGELVLRIAGETIFASDGSVLYRVSESRLVRGDGESAILEDDRIVFGDPSSHALRVTGADEPSTKRTALVVFALLAVCGR